MENTITAKWEDKANAIIQEMCLVEYRKVNRKANGRYRAKQRPITVPFVAAELVKCLGMHDRTEAEETAKAIFIKLAIIPEWAND